MKLGPISAARLLQHAEFMEQLPVEAAEHFHMSSFFGEDFDPGRIHTVSDLLHTCETTACALGWAAFNQECKSKGVFAAGSGGVLYDRSKDVEADMGRVESCEEGEYYFLVDTEDTYTGWLFARLFAPNLTLRTPKEWAALCREFVKEHT
jgi:hypothetical protein